MPDTRLIGREFSDVLLRDHPNKEGRLVGNLPISSRMPFIVSEADTGKAQAGEYRNIKVLTTKRKRSGYRYAIVTLI